jgi:hypothetical protein
MQPGLVDLSQHAAYYSVFLKDRVHANKTFFRKILGEMLGYINNKRLIATDDEAKAKWNTASFIGAVGIELWEKWVGKDHLQPSAQHDCIDNLVKGQKVFNFAKPDFWFWAKSDNKDVVAEMVDELQKKLKGHEDEDNEHFENRVTYGYAQRIFNDQYRHNLVLGCRFAENVTNPTDKVTLLNHTLISQDE